MAEHALDMAQGRGGDQAAEMTLDGFTFYGGVSTAWKSAVRCAAALWPTSWSS